MQETVYVRTLQRTADLLGGAEKLADYLKVHRTVVDGWLTDASSIPPDKFLECVDYLLDVHVKWLRDFRQGGRRG